MEKKEQIRQLALQRRDSMSLKEIKNKSEKITKKLLSMDQYRQAASILFYTSFRSEVITDDMINAAINQGKKVFLPVVSKSEKRLDIKNINSIDDLVISPLGIREPKPEGPIVDEKKINLVIVPGCCFDKQGYRLGYGGGYYDRLIGELREDTLTIALAFESQVIKSVPVDKHDKKIDTLITEDAIYVSQS